MKNLPLFIGAILFSSLFHKQGIGLNFSLFSIVTLVILFFYNKTAFKVKSTIVFTISFFVAAFSVFVYNNSLSILAYIVTFITLTGHVSHQNTSIYINWLNGFFSSIAGFFYRNFNTSNASKIKTSQKDIDYLHLTKIVGIPLVVVIIFIALYKNGNPMFESIVNNINFKFINFQWLLFSVLGYYLLSNISKPVVVNPITNKDVITGNILKQKGDILVDNLKKEHQLGFILITVLNVLIVFFLITDITYLINADDFRASVFSSQVHSGINALIASIVMAIIIILYFFRGNLNFYKENKQLKLVAYIWIILNSILVINIAIKDYQYIYYFGFTYKRIGVLVYLLLTVIGLISTFIKVNKIKNFWYLFRINALTAFAILIVSCTINWDSLITTYNLYYAKSMDFNYLVNLSDNNTFILKYYMNTNDLNLEKELAIEKKYKSYIIALKDKNWQEIQFDNFKIK